jgi:hypothetical protein
MTEAGEARSSRLDRIRALRDRLTWIRGNISLYETLMSELRQEIAEARKARSLLAPMVAQPPGGLNSALDH